jgi:ubiquitin carboxyl-terminal hydrolase 22/27/51
MRPYAIKADALPDEMYLYDLFAVVTHEGKLDNGHYWADVLSEDEWWHCDDDKGELAMSYLRERADYVVTPTTLKEVLGQKAYMLFYVKRTLAYASVSKTTIPAASPANTKVVGSKAPVGMKALTSAKTPGARSTDIGGKKTHPIKVCASCSASNKQHQLISRV